MSVDDSLREQSKVLLRKLKEKQTRLQSFVHVDNDEPCQNNVTSEMTVKPKQGTMKKSPIRVLGQNNEASSNVTEKADVSLQKFARTPSKEGRSRLHRRRTKSTDDQVTTTAMKALRVDDNKENLVEMSPQKSSLQSKQIYSNDGLQTAGHQFPSYDTTSVNTDLTDIRKEVEEQVMEDLRSNKVGKESSANADDDAATPNVDRRRQIINRNVKVNGVIDVNASALLKECEEDYTRLNYSYSNVDDTDLKFLQERLGCQGDDVEEEPVRDTDPGTRKYSENLDNPGNSRKIAKFIKETKKPKSILLSTSNRSNKSSYSNSSRVSFRSPTRDSSGHLSYQMDSFSKQQQKMLGYDWIAALLDNDSNAVNQSETFFEELKEFRKLNLEECVNSMYMDPPQELWEHPEREPSPVQRALEETKVKPYVVNDRLFPEPVQRSLFADYDYQEPEARKDEERVPTYDEPRFVRVSIPRSTLMPAHRVKPHRRNSLEAADSMALSEHCQKGYNSIQPSMVPASSNIALRDSTKGVKSAMKTTLDDAEKLAANYPYHWDPKEQSICRPLPRPTYIPELSYADNTWPTVPGNSSTSFNQSSDGLKKATDDLLNSTYSLMYEMKRLKMERSDDPIRL
ncbi:hypothetical protein ACF0H5_019775 [Mactra antiquata]